MSKKKGRDFNCPFTSNAYHVCADFCFEKMSEKHQDVGKEPEVLEYPVQNKEMTKVQRKGATPTSLKAVKSFNSCAGNFFSTSTRERMKRIWVITERSDVHPDCKNANNPYHKCAEYCFKYIPNGEQHCQVMELNNLEGEKIFNSCGRISLQSQCMYASNPQDECTNFCFKNGPDSNTREGENPMEDSTNSQESGALPKQLHVSIPYHNGVECFFENTPEQMLPQKALNPNEEIKTSVASKSEVKLECRNANPYNIYDESCFHSQPEDQDLEAMAFAKDEKEVVPKPQREINSNCENVSNPYVEYCFKNVPEKDQLGLAATKSKEENKIALYRERLVNHECQFTSNPYHTCAEYCCQKAPECDSDCFQHKLDQNKARRAIIFPDQILKNSEDSNLEEESNPDCDYTDFSEGITLEVVAKDLMREVEMRITKEPSDAQPLLIVSSGLFLEWAKYCSQENEAEDKIFMQVEKRAFDTKNIQDNDILKCNDSSNLAKVKSCSLQSSLPTSVLFFLGFLFALFKWTEVIHSVVMSSERKSSGRLMHKRPVKS